ncbi:hypothetical protein FO519_002390 [Halicephalobus sp. NKZ332]|nr:hypothetical protein FO519_002390 [Halicephalobus sp. NKZ332]
MNKTFLLVFLGLLAFSAAQKLQTCTSTTLEFTVMKGKSQVLLYTSTLHTKEVEGSPMTQFFVTGESFSSTNMSAYHPNGDGIYVSVGGANYMRCYSIGGYCSWLVGNETVRINLPLGLMDHHGMAQVTENILDEGGISLSSGEFFTEDNNCQEIEHANSSFSGYVFHVRQCCKTFKPVPAPVADYPKCTQFNSSVSFYSNGLVFAAINATLNVTDKGLNISTISMGPIQGSFSLSQNAEQGYCGGRLGANSTCADFLPKSDFKVIFPVTIKQLTGQTWQYTASGGRIIRRNGIYEKEEGIRFTHESPCLEQYKSYSNNQIYSASHFCCSGFAKN